MLKWMLVFLLLSCSFGFSQENDHLGKNNVDSLAIYYDLIAEENDDSHYGPNVAGMVIGGLLVGGGTFFSVVAVNAASDADWLSAVGAGLFTAASVPFYLVGLPVFLYNTYKFAVRKGHANRRDEYIDALKRYKERQRESSVEWMLVPSVDLANAGGGLNLLVAF